MIRRSKLVLLPNKLASSHGSNGSYLLFVVAFSTAAFTNAAGPLVGPGTVGSYQGGGGGRQYGGFVRVQDPPVGIFVAGSSLMEMNGLYAKIERVPTTLQHTFQLAYKHDYTGWYMALVVASKEIQQRYGTGTEWILIDNDGSDRFHAQGDSLIPGAGTRWSHMHATAMSASGMPPPAASKAVVQTVEDDESELPWQVVGIGAADMLERLRQHFRYYKHVVQRAIMGQDFAHIQFPEGSSEEAEPPEKFEPPDILASNMRSTTCIDTESDLGLQEALRVAGEAGDKWAAALLHRHIAICLRWDSRFDLAAKALHAALKLFPRYKDALLELGKLHLDRGQYNDAIVAFERVVFVDRKYAGIDLWLVRAHAHLARGIAEETKQRDTHPVFQHCIAWRQTSMCDPWNGHREPANDLSCTAQVASGLSGYCECRYQKADGTHARAAESQCGHLVFNCEDECRHQYPDTPLPSDTSDLCTLKDAPAWCSPNHYLAIGVRCDFGSLGQTALFVESNSPETSGVSSSNQELKRAYKRASLQVHPDKQGGSMRAFQRVALAFEILSDATKRGAYDAGDELPRQERHDGTEGLTHHDQFVKKYFPERFGVEPFGDPHADRKELAKRQQRRLERQRQDVLARQTSAASTLEDRAEL